jgi:hypothetical protein
MNAVRPSHLGDTLRSIAPSMPRRFFAPRSSPIRVEACDAPPRSYAGRSVVSFQLLGFMLSVVAAALTCVVLAHP